ncbi:La domain containing protein [Nitzschia inconspicua]|uniref:La domain containing protein n=1 Tax=Nitzschia inconspicua TaxID=303405 RepID=A0A9K3LVG8_9STRA|nr:La domain containing protein [Nitzschia inconspicua]
MSPSAEDRPRYLNGESMGISQSSSASEAGMCSDDCNHVDQLKKQQEQRVFQLLAKQLEYYFSTVNLEKDTYLSTLRSLNDGYVPVSIIANFGKVQSLVPLESAFEAVQTAATNFSNLLEVVMVSSDTGKRVLNDDKSLKAVVAVGPVTGEPIPMDHLLSGPTVGGPHRSFQGQTSNSKDLATSFSASPSISSTVQNTIILRETPDGVSEESIRELFAFEGCPAIESLHLDLQSCWFVTLDTSSRDTMVDVMFKLRSRKFSSGEAVKARLKSSTLTSLSPCPVPVTTSLQQSSDPKMFMYAPQLIPGSQDQQNGSKKKQSKGRKIKGKNQQQQVVCVNKHNRHSKSSGREILNRQQGKHDAPSRSSPSTFPPNIEEKRQNPPKLGEEDFPLLPLSEETQTNKIEVEKVPDARSDADNEEFVKNRMGGFSDSSSTATASTSSTPTPSQPNSSVLMGGYAAAARKPAAPAIKQNKPSEIVKMNVDTKRSKTGESEYKPAGSKREAPSRGRKIENDRNMDAAVMVQPPSWGGGRSFADILRKET